MGIITFLSSLVDRYDNWYLGLFKKSTNVKFLNNQKGSGTNYFGYDEDFYGSHGTPSNPLQ